MRVHTGSDHAGSGPVRLRRATPSIGDARPARCTGHQRSRTAD